jgi:purine-binding chemotaxis protein CheW
MRILVLEVVAGGRLLVLGLVADRVVEVIALAEDDIESAPDIGVSWRSDYIRGVGRRNGQFVIIFNLARLFSAEDTRLVAASGGDLEVA